MAKKIVYHATLSDDPPHVYGEPFHAGTYRSAHDRLDDEITYGVDWQPENEKYPNLGVGTIHEYEVSDKAPTSRRTWEDPMYFDDESKAVPEHKQNRIYPYKNEREDKGATSYVIPSNFVGNHVKHLNKEQFLINDIHDRGDTVYNTMSTMVGGRKK